MSNTRDARPRSNPYENASKSRKEWASWIADGFPSPVSYRSCRPVKIGNYWHMIECTPVHLRRAPL